MHIGALRLFDQGDQQKDRDELYPNLFNAALQEPALRKVLQKLHLSL